MQATNHFLAPSVKTLFADWPEHRLIARVNELSCDTLEGAIERGLILKTLNLAWHKRLENGEYELSQESLDDLFV